MTRTDFCVCLLNIIINAFMVDPIKALIILKMEGKHETEVPLTVNFPVLHIVDSMASKYISFWTLSIFSLP